MRIFPSKVLPPHLGAVGRSRIYMERASISRPMYHRRAETRLRAPRRRTVLSLRIKDLKTSSCAAK